MSLQTIADRTKLSIDGAEFLLMKTLSLHLIEGVIDEVDSSVQARALASGTSSCVGCDACTRTSGDAVQKLSAFRAGIPC